MAGPLQERGDEGPYRLLVFHNEDGGVVLRRRGTLLDVWRVSLLVRTRQQHGEGRALAYRAFRENVAAALLDDAVDRGQPEAGALP